MRRARYAPIAIMLAGFALRVLPILRESLWRDEVDVIRFALAPPADLLGNFVRAGMNGPLYLIFMRGWLALGGANDFALRYFSALCGAAGIALMFALAKSLGMGRRGAGWAAGLMALAPVMVWYSGEGKMYALLVAITLLALVCARRGWWLAFALCASAGFYIHVLFVLFVPVAFVFFLSGRKTKGGWLAFAALTLPYLPVLAWQLPALAAGFQTGHTFYPLDQTLLNLLYAWGVGVATRFPFGAGWQVGLAASGLLGLMALVGLARLPGRRAALLAWLVLPALLITLISTRSPVFEPRYLLWCAPALYVLLAAGLQTPGRVGRAQKAIALFVCAMGLVAQFLFPLRPDIRGAAAHITQNAQPGDAALMDMPYARFAFEHYWPAGLMPIIEAPYTNDDPNWDEVSAELSAKTSATPARRVWLIESEPEMWDTRHLAREWLAQNAALLEHVSAGGVEMWLYQLGR